jgi:hypothetical protein
MNLNFRGCISAFSLLTVFFTVFFMGCKPDLKVNAPYKEIPVVYGLLNLNESVHNVKINKVFLGEADAFESAKYKDSTDYGEVLEVKIFEIKNGVTARTFDLIRTAVANKQPGAFPQEQFVYQFSTPANAPLDKDAKYRLISKNTQTGYEISSETSIVQPFSIENPSNIPQRTVNFMTGKNYGDLNIKWTAAKNSVRNSLKIVFSYLEVDLSNAAAPDTAFRSIEWNYNNIKSKTAGGGELLVLKMSGSDFFNRLSNVIPDAPANIERIIYDMDFYFDVAGEDLNTYMEVNEPSSGIVQEKPDFTNIAGGIGVFSSRYNAAVLNKMLSNDTRLEIKNGDLLRNKGFKRYFENIKGQFLCIEDDGKCSNF